MQALKEKKSLFIWNEGSGLQKSLIDGKNTIDAFDVPLNLAEYSI